MGGRRISTHRARRGPPIFVQRKSTPDEIYRVAVLLARGVASAACPGYPDGQFTALATSVAMVFSASVSNALTANDVGQKPPSSRFAFWVKPKVK